MKHKLIIFDFDGPINNLIEAKKRAIYTLADKYSVEFLEEAVWQLINYIDQIYENEGIYDYKQIVAQALKNLLSQGLISITEENIENFSTSFALELSENIKLDKQVLTLIENIKTKTSVKVCIYTSQKTEYVLDLLVRHNVDENLFEKVYGRESFVEKKPSMTNLKQIGQDFGVSVNQIVVIGDNVAIDLAPAHYLGMHTVLMNPFVDNVVATSNQLADILEKI